MPPIRFRWLLPATLLTLMSAASAQKTPAADPLDAQAQVPRLTHDSSLAQYRRMSVESVGSWRKANDNVGRIGGWRTYLREAQQPDAPASAAGAAKPAAADKAERPARGMPAGHHGHPVHKMDGGRP